MSTGKVNTSKMTGSKSKFKITAAPLDSYTAKSLYEMKFPVAAKVIAQMDTMQKAFISCQAQEHIDCLYEQANRFGNEDYEASEQPTMSQFRGIMGKIKHWEIIIYWLLEIDIMMEAQNLAELAVQAEAEIIAAMTGDGQIWMAQNELKKREKLIEQSKACTPHTTEIMNRAADLTAMFFATPKGVY